MIPVPLIIAVISGITTLTPLLIEAIRSSQEMTPEEKAQMLADLIASTDKLAEAVMAYQPLPPTEEPA